MPARLFHVTASGNRTSIREHGLDWRRMGDFPAVSGNLSPDANGNFLAREGEVDWFTWMALDGHLDEVDVWQVDLELDVVDLELDPPAPFFEENGHLVWPAVIPLTQLTLLRTTSEIPAVFDHPPELEQSTFAGGANEIVIETPLEESGYSVGYWSSANVEREK